MIEAFFSGTAGLIEGQYHNSNNDNANNLAVIFPPDPRYDATMLNKTSQTIAKALQVLGFTTLSLNYRGVGRSAGKIATETKELQENALQDATSAMDWIQLRNKGFKSFWVAGFSFGAWVAMQAAMRRPEVCGAIFVCPPIGQHDTAFLMPCPVPCVVVHASHDAIVPEAEVNQFVCALNRNRGEIPIAEYFVIQGTDHFFSGALPELAQVVTNYTSSRLRSGVSNKPLPGFKERKRRRAPTPGGKVLAT